MCISSVLKVSVVYSAPMVPFAASTTVGHMAAIAAPCQSTLTKKKKRQIPCQFWMWSWESKGKSRSHLNMDNSEFLDFPVNPITEHGNESQRDRSRSRSPNVPKMATFKRTESPNREACLGERCIAICTSSYCTQ